VLAEVLAEGGAFTVARVVFVDDEVLRRLHGEFLGDDSPTDVITFPFGGDDDSAPGAEQLLGEVYVSVDAARRQAPEHGESRDRELCLYALHGVLHLLGYDDQEGSSRRRMREAEKRYLKRLDEALAVNGRRIGRRNRRRNRHGVARRPAPLSG
jgi:probable rRNA maturation factor